MLATFGIPPEGIGIGVDRIVDMLRTTANAASDIATMVDEQKRRTSAATTASPSSSPATRGSRGPPTSQAIVNINGTDADNQLD